MGGLGSGRTKNPGSNSRQYPGTHIVVFHAHSNKCHACGVEFSEGERVLSKGGKKVKRYCLRCANIINLIPDED